MMTVFDFSVVRFFKFQRDGCTDIYFCAGTSCNMHGDPSTRNLERWRGSSVIVHVTLPPRLAFVHGDHGDRGGNGSARGAMRRTAYVHMIFLISQKSVKAARLSLHLHRPLVDHVEWVLSQSKFFGSRERRKSPSDVHIFLSRSDDDSSHT
jgi:hypothetical protein